MSKKTESPLIKKCLDHLKLQGASDKTIQIVYMYMKELDRSMEKEKEKQR